MIFSLLYLVVGNLDRNTCDQCPHKSGLQCHCQQHFPGFFVHHAERAEVLGLDQSKELRQFNIYEMHSNFDLEFEYKVCNMVNFNPRITWEKVVYASEAKKSEF